MQRELHDNVTAAVKKNNATTNQQEIAINLIPSPGQSEMAL